MSFAKLVASQFIELPVKLRRAKLPDSPEYYVRKNLYMAFFASLALAFVLLGVFKTFAVLFAVPVLAVLVFLYLMKRVDLVIVKLEREISKEIVFAVRFLIVELDSGVSVYKAFRNLGKSYDHLGMVFNEIVLNVDMGVPMIDAINQGIEYTPSEDLRKILWQILNTIKTGAPVSEALRSVLDQIIREQKISITEYGRKLNPLAMFYMMVAIIVPSLGTTMLVVIATFTGINLSVWVLLSLVFFLAFIQFMFLSIIRSSRPPVDM